MDENRGTRRQYLEAVTVAGIVGLAGCQSSTDAGSTEQPDGSNGSQTAGSAETSLEPPSGTSEDGIEDRGTLLTATREALAANDYALHQRLASAGSGGVDVTQQTRSSLTDETQLFVFDAASETNRLYITEGKQYAQRETDDGIDYSLSAVNRPFEEMHAPEQLDGTESLGGILDAGSYIPTETVSRNGQRLLRFELDAVDIGSSAEVTDSSGKILLSEGSVVRAAELTLTVDDGETRTREQSFAIPQLGELTVEPPDWIENVPESTAEQEGSDDVQEVVLAADGALGIEPAEVRIRPGTTVRWRWETAKHNLVPESQPAEADWKGHPSLAEPGFTYEYTFRVEGEYHYRCEPHAAADETGTIIVTR